MIDLAPVADRLPAALLALAPLRLPNRRQKRYVADDLYVSLDQLALRDQTIVRFLYQVLTELLFIIADTTTSEDHKWKEVTRWTQRNNLDEMIDRVRLLGLDSHALGGGDENLAKAVHDMRGGALAALLGRLQMVDYSPRQEGDLNTLFVLARDHLKIMRSATVGLDEKRRVADRQPKSHDIKLILAKWHESVVGPKWREQPVRMHMDCRYEGALTECCLESAAVDRIFYNLANNACRHVADDRLDMAIFPVPESQGTCLRFVLSNTVREEDAAFLHGLAAGGGADSVDRGSGESLLALFNPAVSSTGSGFGLTVVADFVAGAFGLSGREEALRERYVGAALEGRTFRAWFHWPIATDTLPPKLDDFHRPNESLSEP